MHTIKTILVNFFNLKCDLSLKKYTLLFIIFKGICDNLLTCTVRAWDMSKPLLFCPAMNTRMWNHPITSKQIAALKEWGYEEIPPINKKLMCGDTGVGAMAEVDTIVQKIKSIAEKLYESRQQN